MTVDAAPRTVTDLPERGGYGPLRGLAGLTAAELRRWFPWRALVFALFGVAWILGFFAFWVVVINYGFGGPRLTLLVGPVFVVWSALLVLVMVATAQGAMANEIDDGTAAWVVAKPVGRAAFVLSKFLAAIPGVLLGAIAIPGVVARVVLDAAEARGDTSFSAGEVLQVLTESNTREEFTTVPGMGRYVGSLLLIATILIFIVALLIFLGTVMRSRAAIFLAGLAVPGVMLVYGLLGSESVVKLLPAWAFDSLVDALADNPGPVLGPATVAFIWSMTCVGAAMWWFSRKEL